MAIEGMCLTAEDENRIKICLSDKKSVNKIIEELIKKYKR
jgi:hypothetical protein